LAQEITEFGLYVSVEGNFQVLDSFDIAVALGACTIYVLASLWLIGQLRR
jgi:hypothetical protein